MNQSDYEYARKHTRVRQEFLDEIDLGDYSEYVGEVVYDPEYRRIRAFKKGVLMDCTCGEVVFGSVDKKPEIGVYPSSFREFENYFDFLSCLKYHEGYHAAEAFRKKGIIETVLEDFGIQKLLCWTMHDKMRFYREFNANLNQLINLNEENSEVYAIDSLSKVLMYSGDLTEFFEGRDLPLGFPEYMRGVSRGKLWDSEILEKVNDKKNFVSSDLEL